MTLNQISHNAKREMNSCLRTELSTKDNGKEMLDMVMEYKYGQMVLSMKDNGKTIKLTAKVYFGMFMETNMKANGKETRLMAKENTLIATVLLMKVCGKMICNTEKVKNIGMIIRNIRAFIREERNMVSGAIHGMMDQSILETGKKTRFMDMVNINGPTVENSMVSG